MARIGMLHPVFAPIVSEDGSAITYGAGVVMGRAVSGNVSWQRDDGQLYGDDAVAETDNSITGYTVDVATTELEEDVEVVVLGTIKNANDEYEETGEPGPYGGHGYVQVFKRFGRLRYRAVWYHKVSFGVQTEETQTKGQTINWGTPTVHGLGMAVFDNLLGKSKFRKKKVFNDPADAIAWLDALANISGNTQGLTLNTTAASVAVDGTVTLTAVSTPAGATASDIAWSSGNPAVATVSSAGVVTGVSAGTAIITANYGGITAAARITVTAT